MKPAFALFAVLLVACSGPAATERTPPSAPDHILRDDLAHLFADRHVKG
jgi:hypothetical protein